MSTLIIAEAGVNHNGDLNIAKEMIELAANAGADIIKFQTFIASNLVTTHAPLAAYQNKNLASNTIDSQFQMLKTLELSENMHHELIAHCNKFGISFLSTAFDSDCLNLLINLGIEIIKIPSGEITNLPYLRYAGHLNKKILLSTGMATLSEVGEAISILESAGTPRDSIVILHCTTEYPAPYDDINLRAMTTIKDQLKVKVGYSDHSPGIEVAIAAVALGAEVIEKHFTLNKNMVGPDHKASLEPEELRSLVKAIRNTEIALGSNCKNPAPSELKNILIARKSIVAKIAIMKGEEFTKDNITCKRPATGISPMKWDEVIGKVANYNFEADEHIRL